MLLFESYNEIESLCKKYGIINYTIRPDGIVDVDGDVYLFNRGLSKLPLKFGRVSGYFDCRHNQLTTLLGGPKSVSGEFICNHNKLTTLEGAPESVLGYFGCNNNQLNTLKGAPESVGGDFNCSYNQLTTLLGAPESVRGHFYCNHNKLTTLEGAPYYRYFRGRMYCHGNPVYVLWELFDRDYEKFMMSLDWDYIRGNKISQFKFVDALAEIGKTPPDSITGYEYI